MKYLIAGLGNIGAEYVNTRHNVGFEVADVLINELKGETKVEKLAVVSRVKYRGRTLVIIKPTTYMNLSGKALKYWLDEGLRMQSEERIKALGRSFSVERNVQETLALLTEL